MKERVRVRLRSDAMTFSIRSLRIWGEGISRKVAVMASLSDGTQ